MTPEAFVKLYPTLFHMATADSLEQIKRHGLLSTREILSLVEATPDVVVDLCRRRRATMTPLAHPIHGRFTLRDQKPSRDKALESCLDALTVPEWYELLNSRVFFWATEARLEGLLKAYRSADQLILQIDSGKLIAEKFKDISVSTINSGATLYVPVRRGEATFVPLAEFDEKKAKKIVEVTVSGGVKNISRYIISSEVRRATKS